MSGRYHKCFDPTCTAVTLDMHLFNHNTILRSLVKKLLKCLEWSTLFDCSPLSMKSGNNDVQSYDSTLHPGHMKHMPNGDTTFASLSSTSSACSAHWNRHEIASTVQVATFNHSEVRCSHSGDRFRY